MAAYLIERYKIPCILNTDIQLQGNALQVFLNAGGRRFLFGDLNFKQFTVEKIPGQSGQNHVRMVLPVLYGRPNVGIVQCYEMIQSAVADLALFKFTGKEIRQGRAASLLLT